MWVDRFQDKLEHAMIFKKKNQMVFKKTMGDLKDF